jgi:hypothetical protein
MASGPGSSGGLVSEIAKWTARECRVKNRKTDVYQLRPQEPERGACPCGAGAAALSIRPAITQTASRDATAPAMVFRQFRQTSIGTVR